jgi:molybdopterin-guanine dinucleotide biosynthesis adapter protein
MNAPPLVCIVGKKNSGKTTTVIRLVAELGRRGYRVMTIKHGHHLDLDREGTDSYRHRIEGGAERVVAVAPGAFSVAGSWPAHGELTAAGLAARYLGDADIVVVEGFKEDPLPKIEIFRTTTAHTPIWSPGGPGAERFIAAVTDHDGYRRSAPFPTYDPGDPRLAVRLADLVESTVMVP